MLTIDRKADNRVVKCILHRVADIPGGVTVSVANLGGSAILEGTPLAKGTNGLFVVCKTATTYDVAKGHHFKVGDRFATDGANGQAITAIDKSNPAKDVITVGTTLGAEITAGTPAFESSGANKTLKNAPIAVAGSNYSVNGENLFVDAWVMAVVRESNAPATPKAVKTALHHIAYV